MNLQITPTTLSGNVEAIPSKSHVHRVLLAAALGDKPCTVHFNGQIPVDIWATLTCLHELGASITFGENVIYIAPIWDNMPKNITLDCGESGSTLRFLLPLVPALGISATFIGSGRLPQRPLTPLPQQLEKNGCTITTTGQDALPLTIAGQLQSGVYQLPGNISSQYITGLLMALPLLQGDSTIVLTTPLESRGYVNLTLSTLRVFGITVHVTDSSFAIPGGQKYISPPEITPEGDWSNAAFWLAAGALFAPLSVWNLHMDSPQGDRAICHILQQMGSYTECGSSCATAAPGQLNGIVIDAAQIPDLVPILAVCAAFATGTTKIVGAARLRIKESDRLSAVQDCLTRLGATITAEGDSLCITGKPQLNGGQVNGYNDHRLVMAMAIAAIGCKNPVIIEDFEAVAKSYPSFFEDYKQLGGKYNVI